MKSLTSYQDDDIAVVRDNDRNDFVTLINQGIFLLPSVFDPETNRQKTFTQEFNLISAEPLWGKLDWVAGVFYLDTEIDILIREYLDFDKNGVFGPVTVERVLSYSTTPRKSASSLIPNRSGTRSPFTARGLITSPTACV